MDSVKFISPVVSSVLAHFPQNRRQIALCSVPYEKKEAQF